MLLHLEKDLIHIHIVPVITIIFYINLYLLMQKGFVKILKDIRAFKNMHHSCGIYIADFCNIRVTVVDSDIIVGSYFHHFAPNIPAILKKLAGSLSFPRARYTPPP